MNKSTSPRIGPGLSGWTLYIVECADGTYHTGMTRNMRRALYEMQVLRRGRHFKSHPERLPVRTVYKEDRVPFREAYAKFQYMRKMNRYLREKLITTKKWPMGGEYKEFVKKILKEN